jgi:hypothetical protein
MNRVIIRQAASRWRSRAATRSRAVPRIFLRRPLYSLGQSAYGWASLVITTSCVLGSGEAQELGFNSVSGKGAKMVVKRLDGAQGPHWNPVRRRFIG